VANILTIPSFLLICSDDDDDDDEEKGRRSAIDDLQSFQNIVKLKTETTQAEGERGGGMNNLHSPCCSLKALLSSELNSK
jgi:hypothetical protein